MMGMKQFKDLSALTIDELKGQYQDVSKEIFGLRNELRMTRKTEKPHLIRTKKRDRARIMTAMNQKLKTITAEKE
jgi:large subunit ribosomal protein L29